MNIKKNLQIAASVLIFSVFLIAAGCGGGGGASSASGPASLSVLITDDLSTDYAKVWVTITRVTALDANGNEAVLYDNPQGEVFNLASLDGVAALLSAAALPPGTYTNFRITLADAVTLVDKNGQTITAAFTATGQAYVLDVIGSVTVPTAATATVAFDFDLKQFVYDPATGLVDPVILLLNQQGLGGLKRTSGQIVGRIQSITDASHFSIKARGAVVDVALQPTATVTNHQAGTIGSGTDVLVAGQMVKIYGNYDAGATLLDAVNVEILGSLNGNGQGYADAEGLVQSFDGSTLVLDVRQADFVPAATSLDVSNVANAQFIKGSLADLNAGQWVHVRGNWEDPVFTAVAVEIEGGQPNWSAGKGHGRGHGHDGNIDGYAEIKGRVQSVAGTIATVSITRADDYTPVSNTIDVDLSTAWYKYGDASCVVPGAFIEAKGAIGAAGLTATVVDVESDCGTATTPVADGQMAEVRGTVAAVNGNTVTLNVVRTDHFSLQTDTLDVDLGSAWFQSGSLADVTVDAFIRIKGTWDGSQFHAVKVEFV